MDRSMGKEWIFAFCFNVFQRPPLNMPASMFSSNVSMDLWMKQPQEKAWWLPLGHSISPSYCSPTYSHISYCSCSRILIRGFNHQEKPRLGSKIKYVYSPRGIFLWSLHKSLKVPQDWAMVANLIIFVSASFPSYLISSHLYSWHHASNNLPEHSLCPWLCLWSNCPRH